MGEDMKTYKIKKLIKGFHIGLANNHDYVAVKHNVGWDAVKYENKILDIRSLTPNLIRSGFKDKYGREDYSLAYYKWDME